MSQNYFNYIIEIYCKHLMCTLDDAKFVCANDGNKNINYGNKS